MQSEVLLILEGTYPLTIGGISTWVHDLVSGLSDGLSVRDAVLRGAAAAAMVVARVGCAPAMPNRPELEAFLAEHAGPSAA